MAFPSGSLASQGNAVYSELDCLIELKEQWSVPTVNENTGQEISTFLGLDDFTDATKS